MPELLKYISVFVISMFKFVAGPVAGVAAGVPAGLTWGLTVAGMMTTVLLISGVGKAWALHLRRKREEKGKPLFSRRSRRIVGIYRRFGMVGIAFLTPILFSPIGGTVIATQLHVPRWRILVHMLWSAALWGGAITLLAVRFSHLPIFQH
ncbi:hypothetical protein FY528_16360 [Hymenobacter lutimineralis]|uniref:Small multi-drug export protein n=1 Tax=Hymenobacter lutimineralis TaxID=2606448 RepID=A0A5D6UXD2_9BACT|nr:hypothetical protein HER32_13295 [Hymenobacter sp. BT18]TYZ07099.1 hypothetical protein FY528_16360 [Hymenobacter lutimineralis]